MTESYEWSLPFKISRPTFYMYLLSVL